MSPSVTESKATDRPKTGESYPAAGVPIGGLGAGCIELGADGRARNVTVNNNRTATERIPLAAHALFALHACRAGTGCARVLQPACGLSLPDGTAFTPQGALHWRGRYPCSHYGLPEPVQGVQVRWSALAPIIPYDPENASLPVLLLTVQCQNLDESEVRVAAMFNWENLSGCTGRQTSYPRAHATPLRIASANKKDDEAVGPDASSVEDMPWNAVEFTPVTGFRSNADAHYVLACREQAEVTAGVAGFDGADAPSVARWWRDFADSGTCGGMEEGQGRVPCGAVSGAATLGPREQVRFDFVLAWFAPHFELNGEDVGNHYAHRFASAREIAAHALEHYDYCTRAVESWQRNLLKSSLPQWFSLLLINCNAVLSTNTLYTRDGRFALLESPSRPAAGDLDWHFYSSIGLLLLFPEFESRALRMLCPSRPEGGSTDAYRHLGLGALNRPARADSPAEQTALNVKYILLAYRDFAMTGQLARMRELYRRVSRLVEAVQACDRDGDGLPDRTGLADGSTPVASSYTSSLWIVALRAFGQLARRIGDDGAAEAAERDAARAARRFEQLAWSETGGHYRRYMVADDGPVQRSHPDDGCFTGQLAGQWQSDFLCLGRALNKERIERAVDTVLAWNATDNGIAPLAVAADKDEAVPPPARAQARPARTMAHFASLALAHGQPNAALNLLSDWNRRAFERPEHAFRYPRAWDLRQDAPPPGDPDRHIGALSLWHVYFALQGFFYHVGEQTIWVRPNLPKGVHTLSVPLFLPVCFGWLYFQESPATPYRQAVRMNFGSPLRLRRIVLRVPGTVTRASLRCETDDGPARVSHRLLSRGSAHDVAIEPATPLRVGRTLTLYVTGEEAP